MDKELESLLLVPQGSSGLDSKQLTSITEIEELVNVGNISAAQDGEIHSVNYKHGVQVINLDGDDTTLSTPAGARPTFQSAETIHNSSQDNEDDMSDCNEKIPSVVTSKRKRSLNVVASDTESDDDDNIPIGQLLREKYPQLVPEPAVSDCDVSADFSNHKKKRLVKLSQKNGGQRTERTDESDNNDDDDSLGDFIESSSDELEREEEASDDVAQEYSDNSDDFQTPNALNFWICVKTPDKSVNFKHDVHVINLDGVGDSSRARKQLFYGDDGTINEETAPCTPAGARTLVTFTTVKHHQGRKDDMIMSDCNEKFPFVATPKRKRTVNIVTSDTESDDDDNIPIGQLVRKNNQQLDPQPVVSDFDDDAEFPTRKSRRLVKLSQYNGGNKTMETDESENDDTDDDDSMKNFIDSRSEVSESEEESSDAAQDSSESDEDFDGILDRIKRTKDHGSKWDWEAEMLADFGKNDMLCMKAVSALYRQQTSDEQEVHGTFVNNGRGFSKFDADRGSDLAEFLTNKVPNGDVIRTVEQLNEFDPNGLEKCRTLATRYSKQLFEIYKNEEDPHFFPT